jgi:hypothetical protein
MGLRLKMVIFFTVTGGGVTMTMSSFMTMIMALSMAMTLAMAITKTLATAIAMATIMANGKWQMATTLARTMTMIMSMSMSSATLWPLGYGQAYTRFWQERGVGFKGGEKQNPGP